ncbi:MAG: hypothetical protein J7621_24070 [Niastella sp.]|nr:hypothetical protein [Niastella sp.]
MKKTILVWALMLTVGISSSFARYTETVSQQVVNAFKKDFAGAQEISWESGKEFAKVTFKLNDQVMFAYYSKEGELVAATRNILSSQLPINLQADLRKTYGAYWITDLFEMAANNNTSYYVTLQNGDQQVILKASASTGWETFRKEKKAVQ